MKPRNLHVAGMVTLATLALSSALYAFTPSGLLEIHYINVQQGGSTLVIGPDGTTVLLDAGNDGKGAEVVAYLQSLGIDPADGLDYTIGGHLHADHIAGFDEVVAAGYDVLFENWDNGSDTTNSLVTAYKSALAGTTAGTVMKAVLGDTIDLGNGALLTVVAVDGDVIGYGAVPDAQANENDRSVAVVIQYGCFDYIWASDLGGGADDGGCTGRSTTQVNVETHVAEAITPGGGWPLLSSEGVDVLHVNHHGSESSTNSDYMNLLKPELALISVGAGQGSNWYHPRIDVVENVLQAQASCITAPPVWQVLQTEEGSPTGSTTSFAGYAVGDIVVKTDGVSSYTVEATGNVSQGPDERNAAGLPYSRPLDQTSCGGGGGNQAPIASFTYSCTGLSCDFTDTSVDFDGTVVSWSWDFGDGVGSSTAQNPSYTYVADGTYNVTLTVTDDQSAQDGNVQPVSVSTGGGGGGPSSDVILSEVFYDANSSDDGWEWIELYNKGSVAVDLSGMSLGSGGSDYTYSTADLSGVVQPGATFVVGGPSSGAANGSPSFDLVLNFNPDIQNSGTDGDGVALFAVPAAQIAGAVPLDAVVYGPNNNSGLIDETGTANAPEVGDAPAGSSIERVDLAGAWQIQSSPTPGSVPFSAGCTLDSQCDDGLWCNGAEVCNAGSCQAGTAPNCDDGVGCTVDACNEGSDSCDNTPNDAVCDDGLWCNGAETCSPTLDCQAGTAPSCAFGCDEAGDVCYECGVDADCDDGLFCNGAEACVAGTCVAGSDPCPGQSCDEVGDFCDAGSGSCLVLSEVFYDSNGNDNGKEWIELYNTCATAVSLSGYSLGSGGSDYTYSVVDLSGTVAAGATFVVGGATSNSGNGNPSYDQVFDFNPDIQNSGSVADGVALFNVPASQIAGAVPIDAVVYGTNNSNNLIDETGTANAPEVGDAPSGSSIERIDAAGSWQIQSSPSPNSPAY